jgi:hypothetical protein
MLSSLSHHCCLPSASAAVAKMKFLKMWSKNRHLIDTPFVAMYVNNENWGFLGTILPNRTTNWEFCDEPIEWELKAHMHAFLDDPNTIALVVNQHHNFTHPKVITVPLGLPSGGDVNKTMFAAMHAVSGVAPGGGAADADPEAGVRRQDLMFVASSNWGPRKTIDCILQQLHRLFLVTNNPPLLISIFCRACRADYYRVCSLEAEGWRLCEQRAVPRRA